MEECLFCKIVRKEIPATVVFENEHLMAFRDIDPKAPTHVLIIPKKHVSAIVDLSANDAPGWNALSQAIPEIARKEGVDQSGFRLVVNHGKDGGQLVSHLHVHLLGGRKMEWPPG